MNKIGVAIRALVNGTTHGVTVNRGEWAQNIYDITPLLEHVPAMADNHNLFTTFFSFEADGSYIVVARTLAAGYHGYISGWIFVPNGVKVGGKEIERVINGVKSMISGSELPKYEELENLLGGKEYKEELPFDLVPSPKNGQVAKRDLSRYALSKIIGKNRWQDYYAPYQAIFIEETPGEIKDAQDLSDRTIEKRETPVEAVTPTPVEPVPMYDPGFSAGEEPQSFEPTVSEDLPETPAKTNRYGMILVISGIVAILAGIGVWAGLYQRHQSLVERHFEAMEAFSDSIERMQRIEEWRADSLRTALTQEDRYKRLQPYDFITLDYGTVNIYDWDYNASGSVNATIPKPNNNSKNNIFDKGFHLIHSRHTKEEGEGGMYYPTRYEVYEKLYREEGYVWVIYHEGMCESIAIKFPSEESANRFMEGISNMGYVNAYGSEYVLPVKYKVNNSIDREDKYYNHENGYMMVDRISSTEICINTSGCI